MKIVILTEGSKDIGFGHITRCIALYQGFSEKGTIPELIINGDESISKISGHTDFKNIDWIKNKDFTLTFIEDTDILIIDSYLIDEDYCKKLSKKVKQVVFFDDYNRIKYPRGIILNGSIGAMNIKYPQNQNLTYLLGLNYQPVRKEFWNYKPIIIEEKISNILITIGGSDIRNISPILLKMLCRNFPEIKKNIITTSAYTNMPEIVKEADINTKIYNDLNINELVKLYSDSDIAISAAGQTVFELALLGIPTVIIGVSDNQQINIKGWTEFELALFSGWWNENKLEDKIFNSISLLKDFKFRKKISENLSGKIPRNSTENLINSILEGKVNSYIIRKALPDDILQIFNLSNDPEVRKQSINSQEIEFDNHKKWYNNKITDRKTVFYIAEDNNSELIGQIRYETQNFSEYIVSISLNEKFRGKGYSSSLLTKTAEEFFTENPNAKEVHAYIKPDNISSIKSFEKAGYKYFQSKEMDKINYNIYKLLMNYD